MQETDQKAVQARQEHGPFVVVMAVLLLAPFLVGFEPQGDAVTLGGIALPAVCPTQRWFGLACPGCGLSRGFVLLVHGQWRAAHEYHRLTALVYLFCLFELIYHSWAASGRSASRRLADLQTVFVAVLIALLLLNWLANLLS